MLWRAGRPKRSLEVSESIELATLEWAFWFDNSRLLEPLGYIPLAEAEVNYYRHLVSQAAMAAWLEPTGLCETRDGSTFRITNISH